MILRFLKIILIVAVILVITISIILLLLSMQPFVPNNYTQIVKTGGELEAKYLAMGASQVEHMEVSTEEEWGNINVYYPKELTENAKSYPVVVMVNGTGVYSSKYPALFKHLASWGFIVIGNEDPSTCSGGSADTTLAWLLNENEDPDSRFYQKVDEEHIGISGHSQGGVGVFNAINEQPHGSLYTCAVSLSPTQLELAEALNMHYEPDKTNAPCQRPHTIAICTTGRSPSGTLCFRQPYRDAVSGRFRCLQQPADKHRRHSCIVRPVAGSRQHRAKFSAARSPLRTGQFWQSPMEFGSSWREPPFIFFCV